MQDSHGSYVEWKELGTKRTYDSIYINVGKQH